MTCRLFGLSVIGLKLCVFAMSRSDLPVRCSVFFYILGLHSSLRASVNGSGRAFARILVISDSTYSCAHYHRRMSFKT